ncbi:hypothetical protein ACIA03_23420 [Nocardioides sp. NPDC051685]|uniref:hypothetical protein n=1 Tax=Nocardioides sp. NPDC051685 TaxID=3364334 RepID=UPI003797EA42
MTTTTIPTDDAEEHRQLSDLRDREDYVRRWVNTWVALGAGIVAVICAYLLIISNSLADIDDNMGVAQRAVTDSEGNLTTLPGQLHALNQNLADVSDAVEPLPGHAADIRTDLASIQQDAGTTSGSLDRTATRLTTVSKNLKGTSGTLDPVAKRLNETSALLATTLASTGDIEKNLRAIYGSSDQTGTRRLGRQINAVTTSIDGTHASLTDVLTLIDLVNGHLYGVCTSAPINLLHGRQAC